MEILFILAFCLPLVRGGLYSKQECRSSVEGAEYMGQVASTAGGRTCQRWDEQFPHNHTFTNPQFFPENNMDLASNFCRNPTADSNGPWCFTTDPDVRIDYCDIPKCTAFPDCKWTEDGAGYRGSMAVTREGAACIPWEQAGVPLDGNFCRNPENDPEGVWCFYGEGDDEWDYCDVPDCIVSPSCKEDADGTSYMGTQSITTTDKPCQRWDSQTPHPHSFTDPAMFPDDSLEAAAAYCRNPDSARPDGPWCYTRDPEVEWQYCDVPRCDDESEEDCVKPAIPVKHVLHIGVDGMHADCFLNADSGAANIMERLAYKGAYTLQNARALLQTWSGPNWASHFCGMDSETSGVTGNGWEAPWMGRQQPITPVTSDRVPLPCGPFYMKGMDENIRTASFMNWRWIYWVGNRGAPGSMDVDMSCADVLVGGALCDSYVVGNASVYLRDIAGAAERSYTFLHIDILDARGHSLNWCSNPYLAGVDILDGWVGQLLDAIDDEDGEEWLVFLSSDHGGQENAHGRWQDSDIRIPFFMRGPGVQKNFTFTDQVSNSDIIPTAAWQLGLPGSGWWTGRVLTEAYQEADDNQ